MLGRVADAVVLSEEEQRFLEGQVRRYKAPRSLSERCRMILLCAEGLPSKAVAVQLGVHEHTVESGAGVLSGIGLKASQTNIAPVARALSRMSRWPKSSSAR